MPTAPHPTDRLLHSILRRIDHAERVRALRWRCLRGTLAVAVSMVLLFVAARAVAADLAASGFSDVLALVVASPGSAIAIWRSTASALLESLPSVGLAVLLLTIFAFLGSLRLLARYARVISMRASA